MAELQAEAAVGYLDVQSGALGGTAERVAAALAAAAATTPPRSGLERAVQSG